MNIKYCYAIFNPYPSTKVSRFILSSLELSILKLFCYLSLFSITLILIEIENHVSVLAIPNDLIVNNNTLSINETKKEAEQPAFLKIIVKVDNTGGGTAQPSDFTIFITGGTPPSFTGSNEGMIVNFEPGTHEIEAHPYSNTDVVYASNFSGDCMRTSLHIGEVSLAPGEKKTCTITKVYPDFD